MQPFVSPFLNVLLLLVLLHSLVAADSSLSQVDPSIANSAGISITLAPWQVSVRLKVYDDQLYGYGHICGGSVITQRVVLTAAHCAVNSGVSPMIYRSTSEFTLVMGSAQLYTYTEFTLQFDVLEILVHPTFSTLTLENDVALFLINGNIPRGLATVQPVAVNRWPLADGTQCTVTGWVNTGNLQGNVAPLLQRTDVSIADASACTTLYGVGSISPGMLCAGSMQYGAAAACFGDSGGPLVCSGYQAGIVSWSGGCGQPGYAAVYTNASFYYDWIVAANATLNYNYYKDYNGAAATVFGGQQVLRTAACLLILLFLI